MTNKKQHTDKQDTHYNDKIKLITRQQALEMVERVKKERLRQQENAKSAVKKMIGLFTRCFKQS